MESLLTSHKIPIYIGFSLSDTHNELLVLLTATQIILWWLSVQLSPWHNFETFVVQLHLRAQSSQSSSLDPKFNASYNFSRVVLLFTDWGIKSRTSCGENPPCAASGALCCSCSILGCAAPLPVLMLGWNSGGHISLLWWGIGNLDQGGVTQVMTLSSTAFNLLPFL